MTGDFIIGPGRRTFPNFSIDAPPSGPEVHESSDLMVFDTYLADAERKAQEEMEKKRRNVLLGVIFGLAAVFLLYLQAREIVRRVRGRKRGVSSHPIE